MRDTGGVVAPGSGTESRRSRSGPGSEWRETGRVTRRGFLQAVGTLGGIAASAAALPGLAAQTAAQGAAGTAAQAADSAARRRAAAGRLADPTVAGRPRQPTSSADNDVAIQALEKRLRCGCGCTLDVYTCRTTDFTCTTSPALHREVVAMWDEGRTADEIVEAFVAKYGEEALMAPEPEGFNLAGYLVPGVVVTGLGATLLWVLSRRARLSAATANVAGSPNPAVPPLALSNADSSSPTVRAPASAASAASGPSAASAASAPSAALTAEDLALLEQALAEEER